jgi:integrase
MAVLYNHAIRHGWLTFNPISRVRTSQRRLRDKDVLTPEEFQELVQQLSVRDRAMVLLIGSTGLRRSEMIALTWSDLNLRTMEVNMLRSCVRNRIGKTKTDASCRPVPLHPIVLNALLEWRHQSSYAADLDFLFPSVRFKRNKSLSPDSILEKNIVLRWHGLSRRKENRLARLPPFIRDESEGARCRHKSFSRVDATLQLPHYA